MEKKTRRVVITLMLCIGAFWQPFSVGVAFAQDFGQIIHKKNSLYHRIFVYQNRAVVTLKFDKRTTVQVQSQVNLNNLRQHMLEYTRLAFCGLLYKPNPERMLVLGLGGGVLPREMNYYFPDLEIDVVEIDPEIPIIAKQFFAFSQENNIRVHIDDGRMFIKKRLKQKNAPKYDLIILDAFNSEYIPFHLMTKEFLRQVKGVLADDGVVVANVFYNNRLFDSELKTFLDVFNRCQVFFGTRSGNAMLVSLGPSGLTLNLKEAAARANMLKREHSLTFDMMTVAMCLRPDTRPEKQAIVLSDDRAPVNWLRSQQRSR